MEFIKKILFGKKYFLLQKYILLWRVPMCPEGTFDKVMKQVKKHNQVTANLLTYSRMRSLRRTRLSLRNRQHFRQELFPRSLGRN